jgi:hypothetical protein
VLTSVDRDDLPDGGSDHFVQTVRAMKVYPVLFWCVFYFKFNFGKICAKDFDFIFRSSNLGYWWNA